MIKLPSFHSKQSFKIQIILIKTISFNFKFFKKAHAKFKFSKFLSPTAQMRADHDKEVQRVQAAADRRAFWQDWQTGFY